MKTIVNIRAVLIGSACFALSCYAQETSPNTSAQPERIQGWDISKLSPEQKHAFRLIFDPIRYNEELGKLKAPEQKQLEADAAFSIIHPIEAAALRSKRTAEEEFDATYFISHPVEYRAQRRNQLTPDELKMEDSELWAMLHPQDAEAEAVRTKTFAEIVAEEQTLYEALHPIYWAPISLLEESQPSEVLSIKP